MDKVKVFLGYAQKYHFWILCVVATLAGLVGWYMASGTLAEQYAANKGTVTGKFSALQAIQQNQYPPNDNWTTALATLTKQEQQEVEETWKGVYAAQQAVLSWPEVMLKTRGFERFINSSPPTAELPKEWLLAYQTEVLDEEFPKLAQIVGAAPLDEPSRPGEKSETVYPVRWENQAEVRKSLELRGPPPTSLQVRLRQEDYWVLQALMNIIRKTNEGAQYSPRVKVIEQLQIGADAAEEYTKGMGPGHISKLATGEGGGAHDEPPAEMGGGESAEMPGEAPPPDQDRYVDAEGKTLAAGTSQDQQFKRLPIYLKLVMDQREITRLLTECANYPLPVEVRQLRINPGGEGGNGQGKKKEQERAPIPGEAYNVTVELHGIIYLFNPPDKSKLGSDSDVAAAG